MTSEDIKHQLIIINKCCVTPFLYPGTGRETCRFACILLKACGGKVQARFVPDGLQTADMPWRPSHSPKPPYSCCKHVTSLNVCLVVLTWWFSSFLSLCVCVVNGIFFPSSLLFIVLTIHFYFYFLSFIHIEDLYLLQLGQSKSQVMSILVDCVIYNHPQRIHHFLSGGILHVPFGKDLAECLHQILLGNGSELVDKFQCFSPFSCWSLEGDHYQCLWCDVGNTDHTSMQ